MYKNLFTVFFFLILIASGVSAFCFFGVGDCSKPIIILDNNKDLNKLRDVVITDPVLEGDLLIYNPDLNAFANDQNLDGTNYNFDKGFDCFGGIANGGCTIARDSDGNVTLYIPIVALTELQALTIGIVDANGTISPIFDDTFDLGQSGFDWNALFVKDIYANGTLTIGSLEGILKASSGVVSGLANLGDLNNVNSEISKKNKSRLAWSTSDNQWQPSDPEAESIIILAQAGEVIGDGNVVYLSGQTNGTPIVSLADASDSSKMPALGIANESAGMGDDVMIVAFGHLNTTDTSAFSLNDPLYVSTTAGDFTNVKPTGTALIQKIAEVLSVGVSGHIFIMGAGRANDIPNIGDGNFWLGDSLGVPQAVDFNSSVADANLGFENGSVIFSDNGVLAEDNANFFWDDSNNRLGIGIAVPVEDLHILNATGPADILLETDQVNGVARFTLRNDAQSFQTLVNASDRFVLRDSTNSKDNIEIEPNSDWSLQILTGNAFLNVDKANVDTVIRSVNSDNMLRVDAANDIVIINDFAAPDTSVSLYVNGAVDLNDTVFIKDDIVNMIASVKIGGAKGDVPSQELDVFGDIRATRSTDASRFMEFGVLVGGIVSDSDDEFKISNQTIGTSSTIRLFTSLSGSEDRKNAEFFSDGNIHLSGTVTAGGLISSPGQPLFVTDNGQTNITATGGTAILSDASLVKLYFEDRNDEDANKTMAIQYNDGLLVFQGLNAAGTSVTEDNILVIDKINSRIGAGVVPLTRFHVSDSVGMVTTLESTGTSAGHTVDLVFQTNRVSSGADQSSIIFRSKNGAAEDIDFATITMNTNRTANSLEEGDLKFNIFFAGVDTEVMRLDGDTGSVFALKAFKVGNANDNVNLRLDRGTVGNKNQFIFETNSSPGWYMGESDNGNAGDGTEFFIGRSSGGATPTFWLETTGFGGLGTETPMQEWVVARQNNAGDVAIRVMNLSTDGASTSSIGLGVTTNQATAPNAEMSTNRSADMILSTFGSAAITISNTQNSDFNGNIAVHDTITVGTTGLTHGFINSADNLYFNFDSQNDSGGNAFIFGMDRVADAGGTTLMTLSPTVLAVSPTDINFGLGLAAPYRNFVMQGASNAVDLTIAMGSGSTRFWELTQVGLDGLGGTEGRFPFEIKKNMGSNTGNLIINFNEIAQASFMKIIDGGFQVGTDIDIGLDRSILKDIELRFRGDINWRIKQNLFDDTNQQYDFGIDYNRSILMGEFYIANHGVRIFEVEPTGAVNIKGDVNFSDGAGLTYGEILFLDTSFAAVLPAQDTFVQITGFNVDGNSNATIPDHTNDHITIEKTGQYMTSYSTSSGSTQSNDYEYIVFRNNGDSECHSTHVHRSTSVAGALGSAATTGFCYFQAGDTVELWVQRTDGGAVSKTLTIEHVVLNVTMIGGAS